MKGSIFIRWGANIPGREDKVVDMLGRARARFQRLAQQGHVDSHREYLSLTGRTGGFMVIDGRLDELVKIVADEESIHLNAQAAALVEDFELDVYVGGDDESLARITGHFTENMKEIGVLR